MARTAATQCHHRSESGWQLIELMVGVVVSGIMMSAVMGQLSSSQQFTTSVRNQVIAADIIQEIIDNARNLSWNDLVAVADGNPHVLRVNQKTGYPANDAFFPRALLQDQTNLIYSAAGQRNTFKGDAEDNGSVTATLTNIGNGQIRLDISVIWPDRNTTGAASRKVATATTIISQTGIHN